MLATPQRRRGASGARRSPALSAGSSSPSAASAKASCVSTEPTADAASSPGASPRPQLPPALVPIGGKRTGEEAVAQGDGKNNEDNDGAKTAAVGTNGHDAEGHSPGAATDATAPCMDEFERLTAAAERGLNDLAQVAAEVDTLQQSTCSVNDRLDATWDGNASFGADFVLPPADAEESEAAAHSDTSTDDVSAPRERQPSRDATAEGCAPPECDGFAAATEGALRSAAGSKSHPAPVPPAATESRKGDQNPPQQPPPPQGVDGGAGGKSAIVAAAPSTPAAQRTSTSAANASFGRSNDNVGGSTSSAGMPGSRRGGSSGMHPTPRQRLVPGGGGGGGGASNSSFSRQHTAPSPRTPATGGGAADAAGHGLAHSARHAPPAGRRPAARSMIHKTSSTPVGGNTPRQGALTPRSGGGGRLTPRAAGGSGYSTPRGTAATESPGLRPSLGGSRDGGGLAKQVLRRPAGAGGASSGQHNRPVKPTSLRPTPGAASQHEGNGGGATPSLLPVGLQSPPMLSPMCSPTEDVMEVSQRVARSGGRPVGFDALALAGVPHSNLLSPQGGPAEAPTSATARGLLTSPGWTPRDQPSRCSSFAGSPMVTPKASTREARESEANVKVLLRVRPFTPAEVRSGFASTQDLHLQPDPNGRDITMECSSKAMTAKTDVSVQRFTFDRVLWSVESAATPQASAAPATQSDVFYEAGVPAIDALLRGYNACIFAYGQTGSGKTYTIMGEELRHVGKMGPPAAGAGGGRAQTPRNGASPAVTPLLGPKDVKGGDATPREGCLGESLSMLSNASMTSQPEGWTYEEGHSATTGLLPRVVQGLFRRCAAMGDTTRATFDVSFIEIYNEKVKDLLAKSRNADEYQQLKVRLHPVRGVFVDGVVKETVGSWEVCRELVARGASQRATAATLVNDKSSRSHAIFSLTLTVAHVATVGGRSATTQRTSCVHIVDLAGSERVARSGATGQTLEEASGINLSLTVLRKVIDALVDRSQGKEVHAPLRESMLTWVLSDSLGGNSKTTMIATLSPTRDSMEESLSTLRYAVKARGIVNVARVNESSHNRIIRELKEELDRLRQEQNNREQYSSALADKISMNETALTEVKTLAGSLQKAHMKQLKAEQEKRHKAESHNKELARKLEEAEATLQEQRELIARLQRETQVTPLEAVQGESIHLTPEAKCALCELM